MPEIPGEIQEKALKGIEPLGSNVYIYVLERATKIGLIEVASQTAQRTEEAIVIAVGKGVEELEPGDNILISYSAGTHIQLPETYSHEPRHRVIIEHNILVRRNKDG